MSRASPARYEAVETGYNPGQLVASEEASETPDPARTEAGTRPKRTTPKDYKPTALRWWFHVVLIACLAVFIGLTEYTVRTLQVYNGDDLVSQLWSRENRAKYREAERRVGITERYFHRMARTFGNTTTSIVTQTGLDGTTVTYTTSSAYLHVGSSTTTTTLLPLPTSSEPLISSSYSTAITSPTTPTGGVGDSASTSGLLIIGSFSTTTSLIEKPHPSPINYLDPEKTSITSKIGPETLSQSQESHETGHIISVASPTSLTTESDTGTTAITSTNIQDHTSEVSYILLGTVISSSTMGENHMPTSTYTPITDSEITKTSGSSTYLVVGPTPSSKTITDASTTNKYSVQAGSTSSPTSLSEAAASSGYLKVGTTPSSTTIMETATTSDQNAGLQLVSTTTKSTDETVHSSKNLVDGPLSTADMIEGGSMTLSTIVDAQKTGGSSGNIFGPGATTTMLDTSAGETPSVTVVQETKTWSPSETWIEQATVDSEGRSTIQSMKTTLSGSTGIFQSTMTLSSKGHQGDITVIQQTETWPSSDATIEHTTTDQDGHTIVQASKTTAPGGTTIIQSSVSIQPGETIVTVPTVIPATIGASTEIVKTTFTDAQGHTTISSYTTLLGGTPTLTTRSYYVATSLPPEDTVITIPTVVPTTIGGTTAILGTTMTDSHGDIITSSYTTVIGGTPTSTTVSKVVAMPVPSGDMLITVSKVVPTTIGGTTESLGTIMTDSHGNLITSSYTTVIGGTPTSTTVSEVVATPVPSGDMLITISTVIQTTIGGTTEIAQTVFTNAQGQLTTSSYTTVLHGTPTSTTEWTIIPTPTYTGSANAPSNNSAVNGNTKVIVYGISVNDYMLGTFLPTILTVLVAFPVKLISINARLMQPFHNLATAYEKHGASPESSIFLRFDTWLGALSLPRAIKRREPVIAISDLLVFGAALLTPLAAETVSVHVPDGCKENCLGNLGVSVVVGRILEALMATMAALLIALIVLLSVFQWRTGVRQNPWSIAAMASLCLDPGFRDKLRSIPRGLDGGIEKSVILKALEDTRYALGDFWTSTSPETIGFRGYGVVVARHDGVVKKLLEKEPGGEDTEEPKVGYKRTQPFKLLTWWGRCLLIFVFSCILIILTYYENSSGDTGFERFMDSQGFGVNFFFTALGVVIGACMEMVFRSVAIMSPYLQLSNDNLPAERSILLSPPTNAFYGIYSAVRQRHLYLGVLSFTTILGELFLPVTLSHVPFSLIETYKTQVVCTWISIAILGLMILVLVASFFIDWPHMPVDPRTVAGAMYYVCDSWMLETMRGMSTLSKKDRDLDDGLVRHFWIIFST
ncbi:hypothetical protein VM1G_11646 [Cytospora mali]|uniref:Zonadhesin n=1 Tax=Cytospora mali TaxID=578113 RepID=A0A194VYP5_CYTMA|nr:hypothetical protein VM1G_11646 [Valsa mali]